MNIYEYIESKGNEVKQHYGWSDFAKKHPQYYGENGHPGVDYVVNNIGWEVKTLFPGEIANIAEDETYGKQVIIEGNRVFMVYAHLDRIFDDIKVGYRLFTGEDFGIMGETGWTEGAHVHFEVRDKETRKTLNPEEWFQGLRMGKERTDQEVKKEDNNQEDMSKDDIRRELRIIYRKFGGRTQQDLKEEAAHIENWADMIELGENHFANLVHELLLESWNETRK